MERIIQGIETGIGDKLIFDSMSGRFFYSDPEKIKLAIDELKANRFITWSILTLNDIYDALRIPTIYAGDSIIWKEDAVRDINVSFYQATDPISQFIPYQYMQITVPDA